VGGYCYSIKEGDGFGDFELECEEVYYNTIVLNYFSQHL
jgi:hypothetical protein